MNSCARCGREVSGRAALCESCLTLPIEPQAVPAEAHPRAGGASWKTWLFVIAFAALLLSGRLPGLTKGLESGSSDLVVVSKSSATGQYGNRVVRGVVQNRGRRDFDYAQVSISLYDDSDTLVGSTIANVNNLKAGTSWSFEAPILEDRATKFIVEEVTGF